MKIVFVMSEVTAIALEPLFRSGIEVCHMDQEVDSTNIEEIYLIAPFVGFNSQTVSAVAEKLVGKVGPHSTMSIVLI